MIDHEAGHFEQPYLARQADVTQGCDTVMFTGVLTLNTPRDFYPYVASASVCRARCTERRASWVKIWVICGTMGVTDSVGVISCVLGVVVCRGVYCWGTGGWSRVILCVTARCSVQYCQLEVKGFTSGVSSLTTGKSL